MQQCWQRLKLVPLKTYPTALSPSNAAQAPTVICCSCSLHYSLNRLLGNVNSAHTEAGVTAAHPALVGDPKPHAVPLYSQLFVATSSCHLEPTASQEWYSSVQPLLLRTKPLVMLLTAYKGDFRGRWSPLDLGGKGGGLGNLGKETKCYGRSYRLLRNAGWAVTRVLGKLKIRSMINIMN